MLRRYPLPHLSSFHALSFPANTWPIWLQTGQTWVLGLYPRWVIQQSVTGLELRHRNSNFDYVNQAVNATTSCKNLLQTLLPQLPTHPDLTTGFSGGIIGWLGYNALTAPDQESLKTWPLSCIGGYDHFITQELDGQISLYADDPILAKHIIQYTQNISPTLPFSLTAGFQPLMPQDQYRAAFTRIQQYLQSGDCYQVNLAQAFQAPCTGSSWSAFCHLQTASHPPYAAYVAMPEGDILSLSPELFLRFEQGKVTTHPIKGTRPRGKTPVEDEALHQDLATHPKDRAENLMIVDLLRNDLSQHAKIGSVKVPRLFSIESFKHVHHLVSHVCCELKTDSHPLDLLFDAFPGGSITGAPKKRSMEIIAELENWPRLAYCGSMGYLTPEGNGQWNIAIRTLVNTQGHLYGWAGGGIVADSQCEDEYQECFNKIGPILQALEEVFLMPQTAFQ